MKGKKMKVKSFKFMANSVRGEEWTAPEIDEEINKFIKGLNVYDIKVNTIDSNYHNNGGQNKIDLIYTIMYE